MPAARIIRPIKSPKKHSSNKSRKHNETGRQAGFLLHAVLLFTNRKTPAVFVAAQPLIFQGLRL